MRNLFTWRVVVQLLVILLSLPLHASVVEITAEFKPDLLNPGHNTFTNTTPWSGVCSNNGKLPECIARGWWSIDTKIRGTKMGLYKNTNGRDSLYLGLPAPRTITLSSSTGQSSVMELRIKGGALRVRDITNKSKNPADFYSMNSACSLGLTNGSANNYQAMRMYLRKDGGVGGKMGCAVKWLFNPAVPMPITEFDFIYDLMTQSPLSMPAGEYFGSVTYTVGSGEQFDFDLGTEAVLDDNSLTVNLKLTVAHYFQIQFPADTMTATLQPIGGWRQWTDYGREPASLEQEIPFNLSSSTDFRVRLNCQINTPDGRCAIQNTQDNRSQVAFDVGLTVPGATVALTGQPVVRQLLQQADTRFSTGDSFLLSRPSKLWFAVQDSSAIKEMLAHPGSEYKGSVVVTFEASI